MLVGMESVLLKRSFEVVLALRVRGTRTIMSCAGKATVQAVGNKEMIFKGGEDEGLEVQPWSTKRRTIDLRVVRIGEDGSA